MLKIEAFTEQQVMASGAVTNLFQYLQVVVMAASIQRYTRDTTTGALAQSDQTADTAPFNDIKTATLDSSGDWLVRSTTRSLEPLMTELGK